MLIYNSVHSVSFVDSVVDISQHVSVCKQTTLKLILIFILYYIYGVYIVDLHVRTLNSCMLCNV